MLIPVDAERAALISTGHVEAVVVWEEREGRRQPGPQEIDEATSLPLWTVHTLMVGDTRPVTVGVRVPARECPAPTALAPVGFERLVVNARVDRNGKLATYFSAAGLVDPRAQQGRRQGQGEQPAAA